MKCLAILGPGLLGGSIALAARERRFAERVHLWTRSEEKARALEGNAAVDLVSCDLAEVVRNADFVVLATPVGVMRDLAERIVSAANLSDEAVVVDVGSVKGIVEEELGPVFSGAGISFVPCHPMAGSEQTGWENANTSLFEGAVCVLTPPAKATATAVEKAETFWKALGCRVVRMAPRAHDLAMARISHFPHLAAAALVVAALEEDPSVARFSGNGFRDSSRVASGPPGMWAEILMENREALKEVLQRLTLKLGEVLEFLENMDEENLRRFLEAAKELRDTSLSEPNR